MGIDHTATAVGLRVSLAWKLGMQEMMERLNEAKVSTQPLSAVHRQLCLIQMPEDARELGEEVP